MNTSTPPPKKKKNLSYPHQTLSLASQPFLKLPYSKKLLHSNYRLVLQTGQLFKFIFLYKVLYRRICLIYANPTHVVSSQSVQYSLSYIVYTGETAFKVTQQVNYLFKFIFLYKVLYRRIRLIYANPTHVVSSQSAKYSLS